LVKIFLNSLVGVLPVNMNDWYNFRKVPVVVVLSLCIIALASCAPRQTYLPIEASLIKKGASADEVQQFLGPPEAVVSRDDGGEEWYYFDDKSHFWQKIPFLGKYLGKQRVESIQVILKRNRVVSATYYVETPS
jgi:outer membrane protein assembly factor BamE (lipoprotein component of BamABCDE complex)